MATLQRYQHITKRQQDLRLSTRYCMSMGPAFSAAAVGLLVEKYPMNAMLSTFVFQLEKKKSIIYKVSDCMQAAVSKVQVA